MLCRENGATAAYTPMLHGRIFSESQKYRDEFFTTCPEDRHATPLSYPLRGHFLPPAAEERGVTTILRLPFDHVRRSRCVTGRCLLSSAATMPTSCWRRRRT